VTGGIASACNARRIEPKRLRTTEAVHSGKTKIATFTGLATVFIDDFSSIFGPLLEAK
jgi:hypothetical protein